MNLMKPQLLIWLLLSSNLSLACNQTITFQAGPFFSTSSVVRYWQGFTESIQKKTNCKTIIKTSATYEVYLNSLLNKEDDLYVVPDHYVPAMKEIGYTPLLKSFKTAELFFVTRHDISGGNYKALIGDNITVPSVYTRAYFDLKAWLEAKDIFNKVTFNFNHSHDSAALLMLKGNSQSTVILSTIFKKLPDFIKEKYHYENLNVKAGGYILSRNSLNPKILAAIHQSTSDLNFQKWHSVETIPNEPWSEEFKQQLIEFKHNQKTPSKL